MMEEKRVKFLFSSNIVRFGGDRKRFKIFQSVLTKTVQTFVVLCTREVSAKDSLSISTKQLFLL